MRIDTTGAIEAEVKGLSVGYVVGKGFYLTVKTNDGDVEYPVVLSEIKREEMHILVNNLTRMVDSTEPEKPKLTPIICINAGR